MSENEIGLGVHVMRDGQTASVRYHCVCGCRPQVKLQAGSAAAHEHCCCGIAHAAGPDARAHLESYLAERRAAGEDPGRTYRVAALTLDDPRGGEIEAAYAIPSTPSAERGHDHGSAA